MDDATETPGGRGARARATADQSEAHKERRLERQALRNDWPIPPGVRIKILQRLLNYIDPESEEGATAPDRTVLMAAKTLGLFAGLTLKQQELDLKRRVAANTTTDNTMLGDALNASDAIAASEFPEPSQAGIPPSPKQE